MTRLSERKLRQTSDVLRNHRGPVVQYGQPEAQAVYNQAREFHKLLRSGHSPSENTVLFTLRNEEASHAKRAAPIRHILKQMRDFLRGETPEVLSSGD